MGSPALPGTCCPPRLWLWPGQAVYVGPSLDLEPHSGSVGCLAVALDGTFTVLVDGVAGPAARSALIPPRLTHRVVAAADRMAFCYLDPGSAQHNAYQRAMTTTAGEITYRHRDEHLLAGTAGDLDDAARAGAWLAVATGGVAVNDDRSGRPDPRIRDALAALRLLDPSEPVTAAQLAATAGLSRSRFLHLFREHAGTSFRRYRLWLRMLRAAEAIRSDADLTTAAAAAGFASPSHFSDAFHAMFGLRPSRILGGEIHLATAAPCGSPSVEIDKRP